MTGIEAPSPHHQSNPKLQIRQFHSPANCCYKQRPDDTMPGKDKKGKAASPAPKVRHSLPIVQMKCSPFSATSEAGAEEPANCQPETGRNGLPRLPDAGGQRSSSTGHTGRFGWPYRGAACRQTMPVSLQNASSKDDNVPLGFSATCTGRSRRT